MPASGRKAAVKIIKKEQFGQQRRNIENEVKILKKATFPCVVEMLVNQQIQIIVNHVELKHPSSYNFSSPSQISSILT